MMIAMKKYTVAGIALSACLKLAVAGVAVAASPDAAEPANQTPAVSVKAWKPLKPFALNSSPSAIEPPIIEPNDENVNQALGLVQTSGSNGRIFTSAVPCCPPARPGNYPPGKWPTTPGQITPPSAKEGDPKQPAKDPADNAPKQDQFAGATETGTQPAAQFSPYMFGDQFGGGRSNVSFQIGTLTAQSVLNGNAPGNTVVTINNPAAAINVPITNATLSAANGANNNFTVPQQLPAFATSPTPINTTISTAVNATQAYIILFPLPGVAFPGGGVPLQNNAAYQQFADSVFKRQFNGIGQTTFQSANLSAAAGTTGTPLNQPPSQINFAAGSQAYFTYNYMATLSVPLPSSGGVVGTTKVSENNSPLPRDRLIFDYDYFSNVPLAPGGFNVNRFSPGFEKTFFNGRTSFELRVPFAATVDSSSIASGATNAATELGNIHTTFKALLYGSKTINFGTGLGIGLPTASGTQVRLADGTDVVRIKNESVILTPYIAALYTPNDKLFAQAWASLNYDASGSPVYGNPNFTGLIGAGRIFDQNLLQLDVQLGYWLLRESNTTSFLTGVAPFVELHYNSPLNNATTVQAGSFAVGSATNRYDELNIATGINLLVRNKTSVMAGVVLPLENGNNRFFDAQFGLRINWLFGPSSPASVVSTY